MTVLICAANFGVPRAALAFPEALWTCNLQEARWRFDDGWDGHGPSQTRVRDAFDKWNTPLDHDGDPFVLVHEQATNSFPVDFVPMDAGRGNAVCTQAGVPVRIELNSNLTGAANETSLQKGARHEMGHMLGLQHSGVDAAHDDVMGGNTLPSMATCSALNGTGNTFSSDDQMYLNWHRSDPPSGFDAIGANYGFEGGSNWWAKTTGGSLTIIDTGGVAPGDRYARWLRDAGGDGIFQRADVSVGNATNDEYRTRATYRLGSSTNNGEIRLRLIRRTLSYGSSPGCTYLNSMDLNDKTMGGTIWTDDKTTTIPTGTTSWTTAATDWTNPAGSPQGFWFELRLNAWAKNASNAEQNVWLDNVRIENRRV